MRFLSNYSDNSTRSWSENDPRFYDDEATGKILDAIKIKPGYNEVKFFQKEHSYLYAFVI